MPSQFTPGTIFGGRYRIERGIAYGGMGAVYEVVHLETERRHALKVMHAHTPHGETSSRLHARFKREAKLAAYVESEFIVDVFDAGIDDDTGVPFLVMELLRGEDLGERLKRLGRLGLPEVISHLYQTALALDKTHKAFIVHRDIKPANLFFTAREDGQPWIKVLDFGIATIVAESSGSTTQTVGTPLYMAPEQFNPSARLTGAADIYALGMVAYTLLSGQAYWRKEARQGGVLSIAGREMEEPASVRAKDLGVELPPGFDAWFERITALDPANRFPTATEAVRALAAATSSSRLLPVLSTQGEATSDSSELDSRDIIACVPASKRPPESNDDPPGVQDRFPTATEAVGALAAAISSSRLLPVLSTQGETTTNSSALDSSDIITCVQASNRPAKSNDDPPGVQAQTDPSAARLLRPPLAVDQIMPSRQARIWAKGRHVAVVAVVMAVSVGMVVSTGALRSAEPTPAASGVAEGVSPSTTAQMTTCAPSSVALPPPSSTPVVSVITGVGAGTSNERSIDARPGARWPARDGGTPSAFPRSRTLPGRRWMKYTRD